jgi:hypothetical protein
MRAPGLTEATAGWYRGELTDPRILIVTSAPVCGSTMKIAAKAIAAGKSEYRIQRGIGGK